MKRLLIMRFSAMGDVAMTVPVIWSVAQCNPELEITILTQQHLLPLFSWMPENVTLHGVKLKDYGGVLGLGKLYREVSRKGFDAIADIHDVLRTKYLRTRFRLSGKRVAVIDKGRKDKHALIGAGETHEYLMPMFQRYVQVFKQLGIEFSLMYEVPTIPADFQFPIHIEDGAIGIAPFAAHEGKIYPLEQMRAIAEMLAERGNQVYLFGAGKDEEATLDSWQTHGVTSVAAKLGGLRNELCLMSRLKLMISMDSSNMHMAAMMGTKTISIWGATHPKAGFLAWNQSPDSVLQTSMPCRPCSIYGNKPCVHGNYPCLSAITPSDVVNLAIKYGAK